MRCDSVSQEDGVVDEQWSAPKVRVRHRFPTPPGLIVFASFYLFLFFFDTRFLCTTGCSENIDQAGLKLTEICLPPE